ncbi:HAMP domain-containing histidine kinase [Patescibacteria group bacterium]|nr:MAG: HAMP domain-containing histidine kinase [Patescibacteria group bacterium]
MNKKPRAPLPSIRGRILSAFLAFGLALVVLVAFVMAVSDGWAVGITFLALICLLVFGFAWHLSSAITREIRVLSRAVVDANATTPPSPVPPPSFAARTRETHELAEALAEYGWRIRTLSASVEEEADLCRDKAAETGGILSDFMYYTAHVLRTPVNAIRWTVESLKNEESGEVTEGQRELLDKLEYSSVKLASVADELQDAFIVLRKDPLHMRAQPCDVGAIVDAAAGAWAVDLRRKSLKLAWHPDAGGLPLVLGDPKRIEQVLGVLIDNTVKYSPEKRTVTVRAIAVGSKVSPEAVKKWSIPHGVKDSVVVSVSDQGMGIPAAETRSVFRPFFRGERARDVWVDGKGLGLTLARAIVGTHGGQMWFTSRPGHGTTMCFSLPVAGHPRAPRKGA